MKNYSLCQNRYQDFQNNFITKFFLQLFEEIVDLLDPAMNPDTESEMDRAETNTEQNVSSDQIVG